MLGTGFYDLFMGPLERAHLADLRRSVIPCARGAVLELGAGTGVNLSYYNYNEVDSLVVSDREAGELLRQRAAEHQALVIEADVERLPFEDSSFDSLVFTLLFCSVADPAAGLAEIRRVLRPGGRIIFLEHVLGCSPLVRILQHAVTPIWRHFSGNCRLNRKTISVIEESGFTVERSEQRAELCSLRGCCPLVRTAGGATLRVSTDSESQVVRFSS